MIIFINNVPDSTVKLQCRMLDTSYVTANFFMDPFKPSTYGSFSDSERFSSLAALGLSLNRSLEIITQNPVHFMSHILLRQELFPVLKITYKVSQSEKFPLFKIAATTACEKLNQIISYSSSMVYNGLTQDQSEYNQLIRNSEAPLNIAFNADHNFTSLRKSDISRTDTSLIKYSLVRSLLAPVALYTNDAQLVYRLAIYGYILNHSARTPHPIGVFTDLPEHKFAYNYFRCLHT